MHYTNRPTAKFPVHLVRIMRILAASKYVGEASAESYIATPLTRTMIMPPIEAAVRFTSVLAQFLFFQTKRSHLEPRLT